MPEQKPISKKQAHVENLKHATTVARNSLFLLIGLTLVKAYGGYVTNIVSLVGDAVGSFADIIAMSAIFVGLQLSQRKASSTFKYGYHRVETLVTLLISVLIFYAGFRIAQESYERFFIEAKTASHDVGIITSLISIVVSIFTFIYQRKTAENINSTALMASAHDKRNDAFVSLGVLGSVVADKFAIPYVEGIIGILLALIIMWTGFKHGKNALLYLLDYWNEPKVTEKIRAILEKSRIVTAVKNIRLRHAGTYIFGEVFLEINPFTDSKDLRDEIHRLDREVETTVEHIGDIVLYIDPPKPVLARVAIPISRENGLHSEIAEDPAAPFHFFFVEIRSGAIQKFYSQPEQFQINQISEISKYLKKERVNILISSMIRPLLYYNLRLNNIKVYPHFLEVKDVENTVKLLLLDI
ncbi:cation diffusion facilitator family transporter [Candidatus Peregrinibacteria bacterium]|nr:cation diffusion facilitator family transporter [Candidatus Peregrinibacteria bacterium]